MTERGAGEEVPRSNRAWVFVASAHVPDRWRHRAVEGSLIPLSPAEAAQLLAGESVAPELDLVSERVAHLVARGLTVVAIARHLAIAPRSVDRYLARLRGHFDVSSTAELAVELAKRGF